MPGGKSFVTSRRSSSASFFVPWMQSSTFPLTRFFAKPLSPSLSACFFCCGAEADVLHSAYDEDVDLFSHSLPMGSR